MFYIYFVCVCVCVFWFFRWTMNMSGGAPGEELTDEEKEIINSVLARAAMMEAMEQERIEWDWKLLSLLHQIPSVSHECRCSLSWNVFCFVVYFWGVKPVPSLCLVLIIYLHVFLRRLSSRLDNIKRTACGDGQSRCLLCGSSFGPQGVTAVLCVQCKKVGGCLIIHARIRKKKSSHHTKRATLLDSAWTGFMFTIYLQCFVDRTRFPVAISSQWTIY